MRRAVGSVLVALFVGIGAGCPSIPRKPYEDFAGATRQVQTDADKVAEMLVKQATTRQANSDLPTDGQLDAMRLTKPTVPLTDNAIKRAADIQKSCTASSAPTAPTPPAQDDLAEWERRQFAVENRDASPLTRTTAYRAALLEFNRALNEYAGAVSQLSDPELYTQEELDALATDVNTRLRDMRTTFKIDRVSDEGIALFSAAGRAAFNAYLATKRRAELLKALREVDDRMPCIAAAGQQACLILATAAWQEYDARFGQLKPIAAGVAPHGGTEPTAAQRGGAVVAIQALNAEHLHLLSATSSLYEVYSLLPMTHTQLIAAAEGSDAPLDGLRQILTELKHIDAQYEAFKKPTPTE